MVDAARDFGGSIPEYYDRTLGRFHFAPFADDLVQRVPSRVASGVLETACGTGLVTARLRERLDARVRMVATDISQAMLDYASAKVQGDIEWRSADAAALPFADAEFGAVVCAFGVMFVPDKERAFGEARRVLREGGVLLFNVWDGLENNCHAWAADEVLAELFPNDPSVKFGSIPHLFNDRARIAALLARARFGEPRFDAVRIRCSAPSAREMATGLLRGTPRGKLVEQRGAGLDSVIERLSERLAQLGGREPFVYTPQALVIEARAV